MYSQKNIVVAANQDEWRHLEAKISPFVLSRSTLVRATLEVAKQPPLTRLIDWDDPPWSRGYNLEELLFVRRLEREKS